MDEKPKKLIYISEIGNCPDRSHDNATNSNDIDATITTTTTTRTATTKPTSAGSEPILLLHYYYNQ